MCPKKRDKKFPANPKLRASPLYGNISISAHFFQLTGPLIIITGQTDINDNTVKLWQKKNLIMQHAKLYFPNQKKSFKFQRKLHESLDQSIFMLMISSYL